VLGAAYYGAALSRQFKMKSLDVVERSVYGFSKRDDVIFPKGSRLGEKKGITIPPKEDQVLEFYQDGSVCPYRAMLQS
jgi:hypoxia up-regulated 1